MTIYQPYEIRSLNGLDGDPAVFLFIRKSGEGILFDCGDLTSLSHKELLKVRHLFVSHTHMDHFMGFDRLLRVHVPHRRIIHVYGPLGMIQNVQSKIRSYTWNLIDEDQIQFEVNEIIDCPERGFTIRRAELSKATNFEISITEIDPDDHVISVLNDQSRVKAVCLDHKGIPSISYQIESPSNSKINSEALQQSGLEPGPWLSELQLRMARSDLDGTITIGQAVYQVLDLVGRFVLRGDHYRFTYLTDVSFDRGNLDQIIARFQKTTTLLSECSFRDEDIDRAVSKAHLTTKQAALYACVLQAKNLEVFHISNIYAGEIAEIVEEAQAFYSKFCKLPENELRIEIAKELALCQNFNLV